MATTGPRLTIPFTVGTSKIVGQGASPERLVRYTTDDASATNPIWIDASADVREFSTSRGRESELADVDAGTGTLALDDRLRTYDPRFNSLIRPMNRWTIMEQFSGETQPILTGYAESYNEVWPGGGKDAVCTVRIVDEFKVLALDGVGVSDPPRDTYPEVVKYDDPQGYWVMADDENTRVVKAEVGGKDMLMTGTVNGVQDSPIKGDPTRAYHSAALELVGGSGALTAVVNEIGEPGDFGNSLSFIALELWVKIEDVGTATSLVMGPLATAAEQYSLLLNASGTISWKVQDNAGVMKTVTSATALAANTWYHIVGALDPLSGTQDLKIFINGVLSNSVAFGGGVVRAVTPGNAFFLNAGASGDEVTVAHFATYVHYLTAARILAHYRAGAVLGFAQALTGSRVNDVLDKAGSSAPRNVQAGTRSVISVYEVGQDPLSELRKAETAEAVDALFFIARDGAVTFLADGHRSASPYSVMQATFDDDGTDLPYSPNLDMGYSDSFLANIWNVTRVGGLLQTASDATSIDDYKGRAPQSMTDLPTTSDAAALSIAQAMLAKYKDPTSKIPSLSPTMSNANVAEAVFRLDIGSRIRVFRTPPGGGSRIDQTLFVQKIEVTGTPDRWSVTLGVSPL